MAKINIGLVSYLNACPLGCGLEADPDINVMRTPPSSLAHLLDTRQADVALVPAFDYLKSADRWEIAVPYGIASQGEVWTVKIFSPTTIESISRLVVDADSHTSINLARVLVAARSGKVPELVTRKFPGKPDPITEPTLLIGDKVWQVRPAPFVYDLGGLWNELFNLPFVYAVWACPHGALTPALRRLLTETAEKNFTRFDELASRHGPEHGVTVEEAATYFRRIIRYRIGPDELAGLRQFRQSLENLMGTSLCRG